MHHSKYITDTVNTFSCFQSKQLIKALIIDKSINGTKNRNLFIAKKNRHYYYFQFYWRCAVAPAHNAYKAHTTYPVLCTH